MKTVEPMVTKFGTLRCGSVAEWLGNRTWDQQVAGSNPGRRAADCDSRQCATVTKQYNLVPANGRWCSAAGEVTVGLVESNGSLPPGLWHRSPAGWLPRTAVSKPYARFQYGTIFTFDDLEVPSSGIDFWCKSQSQGRSYGSKVIESHRRLLTFTRWRDCVLLTTRPHSCSTLAVFK